MFEEPEPSHYNLKFLMRDLNVLRRNVLDKNLVVDYLQTYLKHLEIRLGEETKSYEIMHERLCAEEGLLNKRRASIDEEEIVVN